MNRLFIWIISAFILVSLISLIAIPIAQNIFLEQSFKGLNPDFRELLDKRTRPPAFRFKPQPRPSIPDIIRNNPNVRFRDFLEQQNNRLFTFVADYRLAQRQGVRVGILIALVLSVILAFWLARLIAKPIEAVSAAAHKIAGGDLSTRVAPLTNQTPEESKYLASSFNIMADGLERYEGERTAMFADIAHELKNPLATLRLRMDAIADGLVKFNNDELKLLSNQVDLLSRLTEDLRTLSLADHGRISLAKQDINLVDLITSIVKANQARAKANNIDLSYSSEQDIIGINADPDRLSQVINNLVDNSFKALGNNAWIKIGSSQNEAITTIIIQDSGPGFTKEQLKNLFTRFKKGQRRDLSEKSSGLGLAIAKALVDLHGGTIKAQNHSNGAKITVVL